MMSDKMTDTSKVVEETVSALEAFDPDHTGFMDNEKLLEVMTCMGDHPISREDAMSLVDKIGGDSAGNPGKVEYLKLVESVYNGRS